MGFLRGGLNGTGKRGGGELGCLRGADCYEKSDLVLCVLESRTLPCRIAAFRRIMVDGCVACMLGIVVLILLYLASDCLDVST